jgi:hypothetical protein
MFASGATSTAIATVLGMVGDEVRVACPLVGARRLYVALADSTSAGLSDKIDAVSAVSGLTGLSVVAPTGNGVTFAFPTRGVVDAYVGFSLVDANVAATVYLDVKEITGVIGAAMVIGSYDVLAEVTASTPGDLGDMFNDIAAVSGVIGSPPTAYGATALGAGWPT